MFKYRICYEVEESKYPICYDKYPISYNSVEREQCSIQFLDAKQLNYCYKHIQTLTRWAGESLLFFLRTKN